MGRTIDYRVLYTYPPRQGRPQGIQDGNTPKADVTGAENLAMDIARSGGTAQVVHVDPVTKDRTVLKTYSPAGVPDERYDENDVENPVLSDGELAAALVASAPVDTASLRAVPAHATSSQIPRYAKPQPVADEEREPPAPDVEVGAPNDFFTLSRTFPVTATVALERENFQAIFPTELVITFEKKGGGPWMAAKVELWGPVAKKDGTRGARNSTTFVYVYAPRDRATLPDWVRAHVAKAETALNTPGVPGLISHVGLATLFGITRQQVGNRLGRKGAPDPVMIEGGSRDAVYVRDHVVAYLNQVRGS